jgi:hypothetical protein
MPKPFEKGNKGKPKGAVNKTTLSVKEAFVKAFEDIQNDKNVSLPKWARENPTEFYKIAAKLIPATVEAKIDHDVNVSGGININQWISDAAANSGK